MIVRRGSLLDADGVAEIQVRGWRSAYQGLLHDDLLAALDRRTAAAMWRTRLQSASEGSGLLIAEEGGVILGFVAFGPQRNGDGAVGELYAFYVDPHLTRHGIGSLLMEGALATLGAPGGRSVVVWILQGNEGARAFYGRHGFVESLENRSDSVGEYRFMEFQMLLDADRTLRDSVP